MVFLGKRRFQFDCSINKKGFSSCGDCSELPCQKYNDLRDPSIPEEEHIASIGKRVKILKKK